MFHYLLYDSILHLEPKHEKTLVSGDLLWWFGFLANLRWGLPDDIMNLCDMDMLTWAPVNCYEWNDLKIHLEWWIWKENMLLIGGRYIFLAEKYSQSYAWGRQGSSSTDIHQQKTELSQKVIPKTGHFLTCGVIKFFHCFSTTLKITIGSFHQMCFQ